jgi:hypothetical protein
MCSVKGPKYRCPRCGSLDLAVSVQAFAPLIQGEIEDTDEWEVQTDMPEGDHEWDESSYMICRTCNRGDRAYVFSA